MDPLQQGLLWFLPSIILLILMALIFFDEGRKISIRSLKTSLWKSRGALFLMILVALALQIENLIQDIYEPGFRVTGWFYRFEGVSHIVWLQQNLNHDILIHSSSIFYILGLSFFLAFVPPFLILRKETDVLKDFSKALAINYMFLIPGYLLIHLVVTSHHAPEVEALLYDVPQYNAIIQLTNRQVNCMPSGHTSIPVTITLFAMYKLKLKRLSVFGIVFVILTIFSIIYLGVHWLLDIPAGIAVALIAYWGATRGKLDFVFDKLIDPFEDLTKKLLEKYR